jgi:hypothetical protein
MIFPYGKIMLLGLAGKIHGDGSALVPNEGAAHRPGGCGRIDIGAKRGDGDPSLAAKPTSLRHRDVEREVKTPRRGRPRQRGKKRVGEEGEARRRLCFGRAIPRPIAPAAAQLAAHAAGDWDGRVGAVVEFVEEAVRAVGAERAALCGPPPMLAAVAARLDAAGLPPAAIHVALERYMKCGTGLCGHCYVNDRYLCTDGPVFSMAELATLPEGFGGLVTEHG